MGILENGEYDAYQRQAFITITTSVAAALKTVTLQTLTSSINIEGGERDIDTIPLLNLGQIVKHGPAGMVTLTFEGYAKQAGTNTTGAALGFFDIYGSYPLATTDDTTAGTSIALDTHRYRSRVSILWTNDDAATGGDAAVTKGATYEGIRFILADCFCTACVIDFTDGIQKWTLTFKGPAVDKAASGNVQCESVLLASDISLGAPATYVAGTTKW